MAMRFTTARSIMRPAAALCWRRRGCSRRCGSPPAVALVRVLDGGGKRLARSGVLLAASACSRLPKTAININYDALFPSARTTRHRGERGGADEPRGRWCRKRRGAIEFEIASGSAAGAGKLLPLGSLHAGSGRHSCFQSRTGNQESTASPIISPMRSSASTTRSIITSRAMSSSEDWDFASLEHAARFGFTIGLNVANQETHAALECRRRVRRFAPLTIASTPPAVRPSSCHTAFAV